MSWVPPPSALPLNRTLIGMSLSAPGLHHGSDDDDGSAGQFGGELRPEISPWCGVVLIIYWNWNWS